MSTSRQDIARQGGGWMDFDPSTHSADKISEDASKMRQLIRAWKTNPGATVHDL